VTESAFPYQTKSELIAFLHSLKPRELARLDKILQPISYIPRGACADLQSCILPEVLISGPAGTGKSRAALEKLHHNATDYSGSRQLIARKTRESLSESALVTFERDVLGGNHPMAANVNRHYRQVYTYPNGSELVIGGLDKPSKIMSTDYDTIFIQEAIEATEDDWESLSTRLRTGVLPYQQLLGDCNPDRPLHWLKRRCDAGRTKLLESRHEDNPRLWDGQQWTPEGVAYLARLDALTGARLQRLRFGRWVQSEGVVYEGWDAAVNLIDRFEIPKDWRRFCACDFGFSNPFVYGWLAIDPDGRLYLYREIYMTQRTVAQHAIQIKALSDGEYIETTVCDHDAEDMATLRQNGIPTTPAIKAVSTGLQAVMERMRKAGDGRPRFFILRDSLVETDGALVDAKKPTCTAEEVDGYVWSNKSTKEEPVKENDHGWDMVRYAVMRLENPRPQWKAHTTG
jgi:PBSX family phage terminase large subunit